MNATTSALLCAVVTLASVGFATRLDAVPTGGSNRALEHAIGTADAKKWSCGAYYAERERVVEMGAARLNMNTEKALAYLGYDFSLFGWSRWFTTYICAGGSETSLGVGGTADNEAEFGVGMSFNFIDQNVLDPTLFEDRLRVRGGWQLTRSETDAAGGAEWDELFLHCTVSVVNDVVGNKIFLPNSIAVYGGPIYSALLNTDGIEDDGDFGWTIGLEVYYTESISFDVAVEDLEDTGITGGIHIRF